MAIAKKVLGALTEPNKISDGGGLSSVLVPIKANPLGIGVVLGGMTAYNLAKEGIKMHNNASIGKVHWQGAADRMISNYERNGALKITSGATSAIYDAARSGNQQLAYEMAEQTLKGQNTVSALETYGVTPKFISSLYGMGG